MIPARKNRLFNAWFARHARTRIERSFAAVFVRGLEAAKRAVEGAPVLVVSNHTSWWDPLVVLHLSQHVLRTDGYALMDAKNLRRLPFFSLVGGFGVDLDRPADGAATIKYATRLLDRPGRLVWVFPQGRERPTSERPLSFRAGSAEIARIAKKATTLPAAFRYELAGEERPHLYISFGEPIPAERDVNRARAEQERAVTEELDQIERALRSEGGAEGGAAGFERVHRAQPLFFGAIATHLLARFTTPWGARDRARARLTPGESPTDRP